MQYLISRGAEINALNAYGDSPMANARQAEQRSGEAQALLAKHGVNLSAARKSSVTASQSSRSVKTWSAWKGRCRNDA